MLEQITPVSFDFTKIRQERQKKNNEMIYILIKQKDKETLYKECNVKELNRVLENLEQTIDEIFTECETCDNYAKVFSMLISKNSSRQGTNDELIQLQICNKTTSNYRISIEPLANDEIRPCKNGQLITKSQYKLIDDKNSCLKSFDAKITGILQGYIFAKVVFGNGGHQDNVFEEAYTFAEWVCNFGDTELIYVILIDTDLTSKFQKLKQKFKNNEILLIVNQFQQYIIDNY